MFKQFIFTVLMFIVDYMYGVKGGWQNLEDPSGETVVERGKDMNLSVPYMVILSGFHQVALRSGPDGLRL
jgi:hypothetical protein